MGDTYTVVRAVIKSAELSSVGPGFFRFNAPRWCNMPVQTSSVV